MKHIFELLEGKTIKSVQADTPQAGADGEYVEINFTDGTCLKFRVAKNNKDLILDTQI